MCRCTGSLFLFNVEGVPPSTPPPYEGASLREGIPFLLFIFMSDFDFRLNETIQGRILF